MSTASAAEMDVAARRAASGTVIPRATYRVQLHAGFGFDQARSLVPYLAALGVSHLYCSPLLRARPGSSHGYDVVDHAALNPELGTRAQFDALIATLHANGMGLIADIVPNHMGVHGADNAWWLDVLENGAASGHAGYFDIDWAAADPALAGKVLLPILGGPYGEILERGELRLDFEPDRGAFVVGYFEHRLPLDPAGYGGLIRRAVRAKGVDPASALEAEALAGAFDQIPARDEPDPARRERRRRETGPLKERLGALARSSPRLTAAMRALVQEMNGRPGQRATFDALHALLDAQAFRLAHWRVAGDEINYRRFFDINDLAALRMEHADVFEATHAFVLQLAADGAIDGLRIDHPDGLADPAGYLGRLQERFAELARLSLPPVEGDRPPRPLYVVTEKILASHEQLPHSWAAHGTTGYRFANVAAALFVDGRAKARLDRTWRLFVRDEAEDFDTLAWRCRQLVMDTALAGELTVLATELLRLARADRRTRDFTLNTLRHGLTEVVAAFPVYRTYIVESPSTQDRKFVEWAIGLARRRNAALDSSLFEFIRRVLLGRPLTGAQLDLGARYRAFARRLQQYSAPVAAKGIEDTALYRHHRFIAANDVGGDPEMVGISVRAFHAASRDRAANWPHTMLATSTHDAKRAEDHRLRLAVISELPAAWRLATRRWSRMNRRHKRTVDGESAPSRNDEYLLYQLLVGSLPHGPLDAAALAAWRERIEAAMLKAARESKLVTSWIRPHEAYETALRSFVQALLVRPEGNPFLDDLRANARVLEWYGALNGLSLAVIKALSPGVPDYYQGHEAIELSMADPDNRRPVDFERRRALLDEARAISALPPEARAAALRELLTDPGDGRAKFWVTWRALGLRKEREAMLREAGYVPLVSHGRFADHVVAFARRSGPRCLLVVATRLAATMHGQVGEAPLGERWADTVIEWPEATAAVRAAVEPWLEDRISGRRHALGEGRLLVSQLLQELPVAALDGVLPIDDGKPARE